MVVIKKTIDILVNDPCIKLIFYKYILNKNTVDKYVDCFLFNFCKSLLV